MNARPYNLEPRQCFTCFNRRLLLSRLNIPTSTSNSASIRRDPSEFGQEFVNILKKFAPDSSPPPRGIMLRRRRNGPNEPAQAQGSGQLHPETGEDDSSSSALLPQFDTPSPGGTTSTATSSEPQLIL